MALQTTTQIFIDGNQIASYVSLQLDQQIDAHHALRLVCRTDVIESLSDELVGDSKDYLGRIITIKVNATDGHGEYKELEFKGVITGLEAVKAFHQSKGDLITIHANSTSILAEDGNHYASFCDKNLSEILDNTFRGYDRSKLEFTFEPTNTENIHYSVQHNQSAFSYASRLAAYYNQWFYDTGKGLVFGAPGDEETELLYGTDLQELSLFMKPVANAYNHTTRDYLTDEHHEKKSSEIDIPADGYHGFMNSKSQELFSNERQLVHTPYNDTGLKSRFDQQVADHTQAKASKQVIAKGISDNPGVNLGEIIKVAGFGSYRIIKITHTNIEGGRYKNTFEAIDANLQVYPNADMTRYPKSDIQLAVVTENVDEEGLGRVRVEFPWQKPLGETTPWLRMMTPHSGQDKGFHFIPEIGEEVIINFEGGNAERPFIMGTLYHGNAKPEEWKTDNNDLKAIRTRSGHTIELNDTEGEEKINIYDNEGSIITFDTQEKSLTINATETIDITAKNINITAEENINIGAQENVEIAAQSDLSALAEGNVAIQSTGDTSVKSNGAVALEATSDATVKGLNTIVEGQVGAEVNGTQTKVTGKALTEVSGALLKLN
ncbi:phage baseplate assembly protein V [Aquimarina sp. MMG016]|uniref:type VI secretion system Vgr family protein n=1 Tax=Aquimarina sp. MMG016 TaxID=2822690 RepID=UPI001B3A5D0C|nr:phage baseplate assembly protein V [Aquimarina sp. MMG016]MBQ4819923.1 hypothetical protein [Aquimarina sp. MMG016]